MDPEYNAVHNNRGNAYSRKGERDRAIEDYNRAIELDPVHALPRLNRGAAFRLLGDRDAALIDFDDAVRLCSNYERDFLDKNLLSNEDAVGIAINTLVEVANDPDTPESVAAYYWGVRMLYINPFAAVEIFETAQRLGYGDRTKLDRHLQNLHDR